MVMDGFEIRIVDTLENNRVLIEEDTQLRSPKLVYSGSDTKNFNLFASELTFDMIVTDNNAATFFHLFTGDELRYKVTLTGRHDGGSGMVSSVVWQGFLLAEQFNEPVEFSHFFVDFVATDGLGLLKEKELPLPYYQDKKDIFDILHACLLLTGLEQPIVYAEAVENAGFALDYSDLCVQTSCYVDDDRASAYAILNYIVESIGCRLFSYGEVWYVLGLNRLRDAVISAKKYGFPDVVDVTVTRDVLDHPFFASPNVRIIPPLKQSVIEWGHENVESLVPTDVVTHNPKYFDTDDTDRTVRYWELGEGSNVDLDLETWFSFYGTNPFTSVLELDGYYFDELEKRENFKKRNGPFLSFSKCMSSLTVLDDNYAVLSDSFYVSGSTDLERYASLRIAWDIGVAKDDNGVFYTSEQVNTAIDRGYFNYRTFRIIRSDYKNEAVADCEVYIDQENNFSFDVSVTTREEFNVGSVSVVRGVLDVEKILLSKDGWYNILLYPAAKYPEDGTSTLKDYNHYFEEEKLYTVLVSPLCI